MTPAQNAREHMIYGQLTPGEVLDDRILNAMRAVPREQCVPEAMAGAAYVDEDIEIARGRYLMQPLIFAKMLSAADIGAGDNVLVVGCGTGYSAAVCAMLAARVVAVEEMGELAEKARQFLRARNISNAEIVMGSLSQGYSIAKPYNVILIEGSVQQVPQGILHQLAQGGRLVTVRNLASRIEHEGGLGKMIAMHRQGEQVYERQIMDAAVPLLPGFEAKFKFVF